MTRSVEEIAIDILRCALTHERDVCLVGNVTAREVVILAAHNIDTCPNGLSGQTELRRVSRREVAQVAQSSWPADTSS